MKKLILALLVSLGCVSAVSANEGGYPWDKFPVEKMNDVAALQNGAKLFVNYCLNCHSAAYMRYNRMQDIGLSEAQIKGNLLFASDKVGDTMKIALDPKQAKEYFGAQPPDLSVIARSRASPGMGSGADYLYTYLRTYYRDETKATGWNNLAFPDVAMPHALWELQGQRAAVFVEEKDAHHAGKTTTASTGSSSSRRASSTNSNTRKRWATWWPTCSGWVSPRRASACRSVSGFCCSWACLPSSPGASTLLTGKT